VLRLSALAFAVAGAAACLDCRPVETRDLAIECSPIASFRGELHFDSPDTWRSFLTDRCLFDATDAEIDAAVAAVDFSTEAVFIARGARAGVSRCLVARGVESVDVCGDGLRVIFEDDESGDQACPGDWTVTFAIPRDELRAALDADDV
jgi:hypothetical protein